MEKLNLKEYNFYFDIFFGVFVMNKNNTEFNIFSKIFFIETDIMEIQVT